MLLRPECFNDWMDCLQGRTVLEQAGKNFSIKPTNQPLKDSALMFVQVGPLSHPRGERGREGRNGPRHAECFVHVRRVRRGKPEIRSTKKRQDFRRWWITLQRRHGFQLLISDFWDLRIQSGNMYHVITFESHSSLLRWNWWNSTRSKLKTHHIASQRLWHLWHWKFLEVSILLSWKAVRGCPCVCPVFPKVDFAWRRRCFFSGTSADMEVL